MASFKTRRLHIAQGGTQIGSDGSTINEILYGSASINCPSALGDGRVSGSVAISNIDDGDAVLVIPAASLPAGMILYSACGVSGGISASFMNSGSADNSASADVTVNYIRIA